MKNPIFIILCMFIWNAKTFAFTPVCKREPAILKAIENAYKKDCRELTPKYLSTHKIVTLKLSNDPKLRKIPANAFDGIRFSKPYINKVHTPSILIEHNPNLKMIESGAFRGINGAVRYLTIRENPSLETISAEAFDGISFYSWTPPSLTPSNLQSGYSQLKINNNPKLEVLEPGAFRNVNANEVIIHDNPAIETIVRGTFIGLREPLQGPKYHSMKLYIIKNRGLKSIEPGAFIDTRLSNLTIEGNSSLEDIARGAFENSNVTAVYLSKNHALKKVISGTFTAAKGKYVEFTENNSLEIIEPGSFRGGHTTSITIQKNPSLKKIANGTFENTTTSLSLNDNEGLEVIESDVFKDLANSLKYLHVSYSVLDNLLEKNQLQGVNLITLLIYDSQIPLNQNIFSFLGMESIRKLDLNLRTSRIVNIPAMAFAPITLGLKKPIYRLDLCYGKHLSQIEEGAFDTINITRVCGQEL